MSDQPRFAFVGARTTAGRGTGVGITRFRIEPDGSWTWEADTPATNPGWSALDAARRVLVVAHGDQDYVSAYRLADDGSLADSGRAPTQGTNPAHVCLSDDRRFALVANHTSGTVVSIALDADGHPGAVAGTMAFDGEPGPHRSDQPGSKPHQVVPAEAGPLYVPDKGLDTVFVCRLEPETGRLDQVAQVHLREGSGPRHLVLHPRRPFAYVLGELDSTVTVLDLSQVPDRAPEAVQVHTTLPVDDVRDSRGGEILISPDGSTLYASNRSGAGDKTPGGPGNDTIAVYRVRDDGGLHALGHVSSHGIRPRFMTLDPGGSHLFVANEKSGTIWRFDLDSEELPVRPRQVAQVASPVHIRFV